MRHCGLGEKWLVHFGAGKTQLVSFDQSYFDQCYAIDVKMDGPVLE